MSNLPRTLEELNVNVPGDEGFSRHLRNFTRLKKLGLSEWTGREDIFKTITNDTFKYLKNISIEELTLTTYFYLIEVQPLAFYHFQELKSLVVTQFLAGMSIVDFSPALIGLQNAKLERLDFSSHNFYMYNSPIKYQRTSDLVILDNSFCHNFIFPYLTELHLANNRLYSLHNCVRCFTRAMSMKVLNL